nr:MAG TPA: hypothetical protein [Caudoviricetes sp.]
MPRKKTESSEKGKKTLKNATKQAKKPRAGKGGVVPPKNRQFGAKNGNPRSNGRWRKEDSISYQYNLILRMTPLELDKYEKSPNLTMAQQIAIRRIKDSLNDDNKALYNTSEITDRTEGKARQAIEMEVESVSKNPFEGLTEEELRRIIEK